MISYMIRRSKIRCSLFDSSPGDNLFSWPFSICFMPDDSVRKISRCRNHSEYGLSQWEETLLCSVVPHWLIPYPEWPLGVTLRKHAHTNVSKTYVDTINSGVRNERNDTNDKRNAKVTRPENIVPEHGFIHRTLVPDAGISRIDK